MYVFDTSSLSQLFKHYYPSRFPTLWQKFHDLTDGESLTSCREARLEIGDSSIESLVLWTDTKKHLFPTPTSQEAVYVADIFKVAHFQQLIDAKKLQRGGRNADPFLVARARAIGATLVTQEVLKPNAAKIPNICGHFHVAVVDLEGFMQAEGWTF